MLLVLLVVVVFCLCLLLQTTKGFQIGEIVKDALAEIPHDESCFTQGLVVHGGTADAQLLYESCGLYGKSSVRIVDMTTGKVKKRRSLDRTLFAEGLTLLNDTLFLLSWKEKTLLMLDRESLELLDSKRFDSFNGEGWGLTTNGEHLIVSDGSEHLTFYEIPKAKDGKEKLVKVKDLKVFDPVTSRHLVYLNELEYVNGFIFANIWYKDIIIQINSQTGRVVERYDLSELYPKSKRTPRADVLNGIAFDPVQNNFLLTGKLWPKYYRVNFKAALETKGPFDL